MNKPSWETTALIKYLKECADAGKMATFKEMSALLNGNVQYKFRNKLSSAFRILKRDYQLLFVSVDGEGYKPLLEDVAQVVTVKRQKRIQSETNNWEAELKTIDTTKLDDKGFKSYVTASLKLGIQAFILGEDVNKKLELQGQKTRSTGLEYAKDAIRELLDVR